MMYLLTPEQHAQIMDALSSSDDKDQSEALAMLTSMQPVEPLQMHRGDVCCRSKEDDQSFNMLIPVHLENGTQLYTPYKGLI